MTSKVVGVVVAAAISFISEFGSLALLFLLLLRLQLTGLGANGCCDVHLFVTITA